MRALRPFFAAILLSLTVPAAALAAPIHSTPHMKMMHVTLHLTAKFQHRMAFEYVMAGATVRHTKHDLVINLTTDNLPNPHVLHKNVYVLWATDGNMKENLGALNVHGSMAGLHAMTMMMMTQDLLVTAETAAHNAKPHGPVVLSAMV